MAAFKLYFYVAMIFLVSILNSDSSFATRPLSSKPEEILSLTRTRTSPETDSLSQDMSAIKQWFVRERLLRKGEGPAPAPAPTQPDPTMATFPLALSNTPAELPALKMAAASTPTPPTTLSHKPIIPNSGPPTTPSVPFESSKPSDIPVEEIPITSNMPTAISATLTIPYPTITTLSTTLTIPDPAMPKFTGPIPPFPMTSMPTTTTLPLILSSLPTISSATMPTSP